MFPVDGSVGMRSTDATDLFRSSSVREPAGAELLDVALDAEGWAQLRVRYRFVALAGFPWPESPAPDTVVVELAEQLY